MCVGLAGRPSSVTELIRSVLRMQSRDRRHQAFCHPSRRSAHDSAFFGTLLRGVQVLFSGANWACWLLRMHLFFIWAGKLPGTAAYAIEVDQSANRPRLPWSRCSNSQLVDFHTFPMKNSIIQQSCMCSSGWTAKWTAELEQTRSCGSDGTKEYILRHKVSPENLRQCFVDPTLRQHVLFTVCEIFTIIGVAAIPCSTTSSFSVKLLNEIRL